MSITSVEHDVADHYGTGGILAAIEAALESAGVDPQAPAPADLKGVDEFHTAGLRSTEALLSHVTMTGIRDAVDIGAGLGGTARYLADIHGLNVTGVDLTPEYVATARELNRRTGLDERITMLVGSALELPLADGCADLATMFHVGMNIADKARLMREAARILRPGGIFALFDVMRDTAEDPLAFPLPWAGRAALSFVQPPQVYLDAADAAGLSCVVHRERRDFTLDFFREAFERMAETGGPPPVGIHLLMGDTAAQKIQNYVANVEARRIAPVELVLRKT